MRRMNLSVRVKADPAATFGYFADFAGAVGRVSGIRKVEMLTPGAVGKGTKFRETRVMFGREATEVMTVTEFDPPRRYVVEADSCGSRVTVEFVFEGVDGGAATDVRMAMGCRAMTFMAKVMSPLGLLFAGSMRRVMEKDLTEMRDAVEKGGDGAA